MDLNTLKEEHKKYKKALKTFIILEIVSYLLLFFTTIGLFGGIIYLGLSTELGHMQQFSEEQIAIMAIILSLGGSFLMMISAMATEAFIPFIIVSAIKLGKRNIKIKELEREEPQLV